MCSSDLGPGPSPGSRVESLTAAALGGVYAVATDPHTGHLWISSDDHTVRELDPVTGDVLVRKRSVHGGLFDVAAGHQLEFRGDQDFSGVTLQGGGTFFMNGIDATLVTVGESNTPSFTLTGNGTSVVVLNGGFGGSGRFVTDAGTQFTVDGAFIDNRGNIDIAGSLDWRAGEFGGGEIGRAHV